MDSGYLKFPFKYVVEMIGPYRDLRYYSIDNTVSVSERGKLFVQGS